MRFIGPAIRRSGDARLVKELKKPTANPAGCAVRLLCKYQRVNGLVMANKEQKAKPSGKREPQLTLKEKRAKKAEKKKS